LSAGVVHVALEDVEQLSDQDQGAVSLSPIRLKDSLAQGVQQQVSMGQAILVDEHLLDKHRRVPNVFVLISHKGVHVQVDLLDKTLELLSLDVRHVQKHQNKTLLLRVLYFIQFPENVVQRLLKILVVMCAYDL
jgi:hypothetical protein